MARTVTDVLHRYGARIDEPELADALDALLHEHFQPLRGGAALTATDRALLEKAGGLRFDRPRMLDRAAAGTAAAAGRLVATAVRVADVAAALGVDASRVRHRVAAGQLYTVPAGRGRARLVPAFQLDAAGRPLPGLPAVLAALPADLHPLEVEGFFTSPQPDLEVDGEPVSPRAWLASGGDPSAVAALAGGLAVPR